MSEYKVPEGWQEVRTGPKYYSDFIGDGQMIPGLLLGWLTPDGFVSPDKLPEEMKPAAAPKISEPMSTKTFLKAVGRWPEDESVTLPKELLKEVVAGLRFYGDKYSNTSGQVMADAGDQARALASKLTHYISDSYREG